MNRAQYLRNILTMTTGSAVAQAIPLALMPVLTRLYVPEDFALLALYLAVTSIAAVAATARYELAVALPDRDQDAMSLAVLSIAIACILALALAAPLMIWSKEVARLLDRPALASFILLVPLAMLVTAAYRVLTYWSNRRGMYSQTARARVAQTASTGLVNTSAGLVGSGGGALIAGEICGHGAGALLLISRMRSDFKLLRNVTLQDVLRNAREYSSFPKVNSLHALIDALQHSGLVFVISMMFNASILGFYALTMRVLTAPVGLVGSAVAQVYYQQASRIHATQGDLRPLLLLTTTRLALLAVPLFTVLWLTAPDLFALVFGERWRESGEYAQILIPWTAAHFIVMPVTQTPLVLGRQTTALFFGLAGNAFMVAAVVFGGLLADIRTGLLVLSTGLILHLGVYFAWLYRAAAARPVDGGLQAQQRRQAT